MSSVTIVDYTEMLGYRLKKAQIALRKCFEQALRPIGITVPQYAVLAALKHEPGQSNAALTRLAFVTPQTMIGIVQNLERDGYVLRKEDPNHGRILQTTLTARGHKIITAALKQTETINQLMVKGFTPNEIKTLAKLLDRCTQNLGGKV